MIKSAYGHMEQGASEFHHFELVVDALPEGVLLYSPLGEPVHANPALEMLSGWTRDEILTGEAQWVPGLEEEIRDSYFRRLQNNEVVQVEVQRRTKGGEILDIGIVYRSVLSHKGEFCGALAIHNRRGKCHCIAASLETSYPNISKLIEYLPDATFVIDKAGYVVAWNRAIEEMTGVSADEMIGKGNFEYALPFYCERRPVMIDLVISEDHSLDHMYAYVKRSADRYESEVYIDHLKPGGMYLYCTARALCGPGGEIVGAVETIQDIGDQKLAEKALEESRRQLAQILEFLPDPVFVVDAEERVQFWNRAMEALTGISAEEMVGRGDYEYALPFYGERRPLLINLALTWDESYKEKYISVTRRDDGVLISQSHHPQLNEHIYLSGSARLLQNGEGRPIGAIESLRDISDIKKAQMELEAARKTAETASQAKSEFLANMSHEIRTPLNGVIGMTALLLDTDLDPEQRDYARTVETSSESLLDVINDILDYSKIEAGKLDFEIIEFDLRLALEDIIEILAIKVEEKALELICYVEPDVPAMLMGDPGRLRQVLLNLGTNAIKFTNQGQVTIRAACLKETQKDVQIRFVVQDTGIGIPADKRDRLFRSFSQVDGSTTRKYGGTGLGLAISKQLVEMMGGQIGVEDHEGTGTTFWFTVTLDKQEGKERGPSSGTLPADIHGKRVLVVDDNPTNLEILHAYLSSWECLPSTAADGHEGLALLTENLKKGTPFDMAIVDMMMPGMDGHALGREVKSHPELKNTPLIILTSRALRGDAALALDIGFDAYLTKPIKQTLLYKTILSVFGKESAKASVKQEKKLVTRHSVAEMDKGQVCILLAEDNVTNQKVALHILTKLGYQAQAVSNGKEVLRCLDMRTYNLILMDVQMPEMDGLEAASAIRNSSTTYRHIPIVALTANAMKGDRETCLESGMNDYINKPVDPTKLQEIIEKWI